MRDKRTPKDVCGEARQVDAIRAAGTHPTFIPVTGLKCLNGKCFSPLTEISGTEPTRRLI